MRSTTTCGHEASDALVETDGNILEQIQKDLSQEYTRFMSRLVQERLRAQAGGGASLFDHLRKSASAGSPSNGS